MATDFNNPFIDADAKNFWPSEATVAVSGVNIPSTTLTLVNFVPDVANGGEALSYENGATYLTYYKQDGWYYGNASFEFKLTTNSRDIPVKSAGPGLSAGWERSVGTGNVDRFSITPLQFPRTAWERRRLIGLGY